MSSQVHANLALARIPPGAYGYYLQHRKRAPAAMSDAMRINSFREVVFRRPAFRLAILQYLLGVLEDSRKKEKPATATISQMMAVTRAPNTGGFWRQVDDNPQWLRQTIGRCLKITSPKYNKDLADRYGHKIIG